MIISSEHFLELVKKNKKISEIIIPELIHRLIRQTINCNTYTHFPSVVDIFTPSWDGIVLNNKIEHRFLLLGNIVFEIGTKKNTYNSLTKIDDDYEKRKIDSSINNKIDYSYIVLTTKI